MYSIKQLQGMDYLLKKMTRTNSFKVFQKDIKMVVKIDGELWYGDFLNYGSHYVMQHYIDDFGGEEYKNYDPSNEEDVLKPTWNKYSDSAHFFHNPFQRTDNLSLIYYHLTMLIESIPYDNFETPFYPYLFNATLVKDKIIQLPFIKISDYIPVISLIEVNVNE